MMLRRPATLFATAVGLLKSIVALLLIGTSYKLAQKAAHYSIF